MKERKPILLDDMIVGRPRLRWRGGRILNLPPMVRIMCAMCNTGVIFDIEVENGSETKRNMTTNADEEYSSQSHGLSQCWIPPGVTPQAKNRKRSDEEVGKPCAVWRLL